MSLAAKTLRRFSCTVMVAGIVALTQFSFAGQTLSDEAKTSITGILAKSEYAQATVGICVRDAQTSELIWQHNGETTLVTASCMKAITLANAFHYLGAGKTFETRLGISGEIKDGVLAGNLYILGGGDPSLGVPKVEGALAQDALMTQWVEAVKAKGIKSIQGKVIGVKGMFADNLIPDDWSWDDIGNAYAAAPCGLSVNENAFSLKLLPGATEGSQVQIVGTDPNIPEIVWDNRLKTGPANSGDQAVIYYGGNNLRTLQGTIPQGSEHFTIRGSMPNPHFTTANLLNSALNTAGISTGGTGSQDMQSEDFMEIHKTSSPPLSKIAYRLGRESNNFFAEMFLMHIGKATETSRTSVRESAIRSEYQYLKKLGVDTTGFQIADGSGLARFNGITGSGITTMLCAIQKEEWFNDYLSALPHLGMPDSDLSQRNTQPELKGKVFAKTGLIR